MAALNQDRIIIGTWALGDPYWGEQSHSDSIKTLHRAVFLGFHNFDTAIAYGNGKSEQLLGQQLKKNNDVQIASKCVVKDLSSFKINFNKSLKRIERNSIDTYFIHWPSSKYPFEPIIDFLSELKYKGIIKHIGLSNFTIPMLEKALTIAPIDKIQNAFNPLWTFDFDLFNFCKENLIETQGYSPLAQGILTGKFNSYSPYVPRDMRNKSVFYSTKVLSFIYPYIDKLNEITQQNNVLLSNQVILWNLDHIQRVIVGCRNRSQIENLHKIINTSKIPEVIEILNELSCNIRNFLPKSHNIFNHSY